MDNPPIEESNEIINMPTTSDSGIRFANPPLQNEPPKPQATPALPPVSIGGGKDEFMDALGPSAYRETNRPYSMKFFDIPASVIQGMYEEGIPLQIAIKEIDEHILEEIAKRKWTDTDSSYRDIVEELCLGFGIHKNTNSIDKVLQMAKRIKIYKQQMTNLKHDIG